MDHIESFGIVIGSIKGTFKVELESGQTVLCSISGKIRQNKINIVDGDRVKVKMSPYDLSRGIIIFRGQ